MTVKDRTAQDGIDIMDGEHKVHLDLIKALQTAMDEGAPASRLREIAGQLLEFSSAHFMSEQLLMRLHAYPEYEAHVQEHDRLTEQLTALRDGLQGEEPVPNSAAVTSIQEELARHLQERDRELSRFLVEGRLDLPS